MKKYEIRCYVNITAKKKDSFWYMYEHDFTNAMACLRHAGKTIETVASVDENMLWLKNCAAILSEYIEKNTRAEHDFYVGKQIDGKYYYVFFRCYNTLR